MHEPGASTLVRMNRIARALGLMAFVIAAAVFGLAGKNEIVWTEQEKPILEKIRTLRKTPDEARAGVTRDLALQIRQLPAAQNKVELATGLASLSTEGDFGHDTLQEVATTLSDALKETPQKDDKGQPSYAYTALAQLVRYEVVTAELQSPSYSKAMAALEKADRERDQANFTLKDLNGQAWTLKSLKGKVVLVNFWATWCPPCKRELPDMQALYDEYKDKGLVVLAITDEEKGKVGPFIEQRNLTYPVLLDGNHKANEEFKIEGLPRTFVYDREGKLVAQAIDMRTHKQFVKMLAKAGL